MKGQWVGGWLCEGLGGSVGRWVGGWASECGCVGARSLRTLCFIIWSKPADKPWAAAPETRSCRSARWPRFDWANLLWLAPFPSEGARSHQSRRARTAWPVTSWRADFAARRKTGAVSFGPASGTWEGASWGAVRRALIHLSLTSHRSWGPAASRKRCPRRAWGASRTEKSSPPRSPSLPLLELLPSTKHQLAWCCLRPERRPPLPLPYACVQGETAGGRKRGVRPRPAVVTSRPKAEPRVRDPMRAKKIRPRRLEEVQTGGEGDTSQGEGGGSPIRQNRGPQRSLCLFCFWRCPAFHQTRLA